MTPKVRLADIGTTMASVGVDRGFIAACSRLAHDNDGFYELMELWLDTDPGDEREAILADLRELLDDAAETAGTTPEPGRGPE